MSLVQYFNGHGIRTVSMHSDNWHRLLEVAALTSSDQDQIIFDVLRHALANGDQELTEQIESD